MFDTVTLNGRTYLLDNNSDAYKHSSIPLLRNQSDQSNQPGSQSLNPEGPWRRTQETWHHGSGQSHLDRAASDSMRYNASAGVDPWTQYTLRLHADSVLAYTPSTSVSHSLVVGNRIYIVDGAAVKFTTALNGASVWTTVTGLVGVSNIKLASDGTYVYIPQGVNGLYRVANNASAAAVFGAAAQGKEAFYVLGRLIVTDTTTLSDVDGAGAATLVYTLPSGRWSDITAGTGFIYAATSSQSAPALIGTGEGAVYRIAINTAGTALDVPVQSATLPSGEDALAIKGYLGYILLATSKGVRFAQQEADGALTLGSLRTATFNSGVTNAFTAEGQFVYYCSTAQSAEAGLGRLDLTEFIAPLTPAGAPDIVPPAGALDPFNNNGITTCGTFGGLQFFAVSGSAPGSGGGLYVAAGTRPSGTLTSGVLDYGLAESKLPLYVDIQTEPLPAGTAVAVAVAIDGGTFTTVGTHNVDGAASFTADLTAMTIAAAGGRFYEVQLTLTGSGSNTPVVTRTTFRSYPVTARGEIIFLPLVIAETLSINGVDTPFDISAEIANMRDLIAAVSLVQLIEGDLSTAVYVEDFQYTAAHSTADGLDMNGSLLLKLKTFAEPIPSELLVGYSGGY